MIPRGRADVDAPIATSPDMSEPSSQPHERCTSTVPNHERLGHQSVLTMNAAIPSAPKGISPEARDQGHAVAREPLVCCARSFVAHTFSSGMDGRRIEDPIEGALTASAPSLFTEFPGLFEAECPSENLGECPSSDLT